MDKLFLYNTLTRAKEEFKPIKKGEIGMYTCGPTVYNYAHIGNLRAYIFEDILKRVLLYNGYKIKHVMNITDVDDKTIRDSRRAGLARVAQRAQRVGRAAADPDADHQRGPCPVNQAAQHVSAYLISPQPVLGARIL